MNKTQILPVKWIFEKQKYVLNRPEHCCCRETMSFKYGLFEPCDSMHFLPFVQTKRASAKAEKKPQGSLTIVLCVSPDGMNSKQFHQSVK